MLRLCCSLMSLTPPFKEPEIANIATKGKKKLQNDENVITKNHRETDLRRRTTRDTVPLTQANHKKASLLKSVFFSPAHPKIEHD
jgi:hypothetical protein